MTGPASPLRPRRLLTRSPVVLIFSAVIVMCCRGVQAASTLAGETPLFPLPLSGVDGGASMHQRAAATFEPGSLPEGAWSSSGSESFGGVLDAAVRALNFLATSRLRRPLCSRSSPLPPSGTFFPRALREFECFVSASLRTGPPRRHRAWCERCARRRVAVALHRRVEPRLGRAPA